MVGVCDKHKRRCRYIIDGGRITIGLLISGYIAQNGMNLIFAFLDSLIRDILFG